jgi:hypothetical protein
MEAIVKAVGSFIYRDLVLIIGGSSVVVAFLYTFGASSPANFSGLQAAAVAAIGWVIGYVIQDTSCLIGFVTTTTSFKPWKCVKSMYKRYHHRDWDDELPEDCREFGFARERAVGLLMIGTCVGPCWVIAAFFLLICQCSQASCHPPESRGFLWCLFWASLVLGVLLICLGWLKAAQLNRMKTRYPADLSN